MPHWFTELEGIGLAWWVLMLITQSTALFLSWFLSFVPLQLSGLPGFFMALTLFIFMNVVGFWLADR